MSHPGGKRPAAEGAAASDTRPAKKVRDAPAEVTVNRPGGGRYTGEVDEQGRPHGSGTEHRADGSEWSSASWHDGQLQGRGSVTWRDGVRYEGDFVGGVRSGLGQYIWPDKRCYEGDIAAGRYAGLGIMWSGTGALRCGRWKEQKMVAPGPVPRSKIPIGTHLSAAVRSLSAADGARTLLLPSGGHYVGDFNAEFRPHGLGTEYDEDGSARASGEWRDGALHGFGLRWDADGELKGRGRYQKGHLQDWCAVPLRLIPAGAVHNEKAKGAALLLPDGGFYCGEINEQLRQHGDGVAYRADGSEVASGQWRDGQQHGRGKVAFPNGNSYEGHFTQDQMSGMGKFTWANGDVYEGEFAADKRSGFGIRWSKNGQLLLCGRWAEDKLIETRPVPLCKIPVGKFLPAAAQALSAADGARALLLPCGGYYCGEINERHKPHGLGAAFRPDGELQKCGRWTDGKLAEARGVPLSLIPAAAIEGKEYAGAALLLPNGSFNCGDPEAPPQPHGKGVTYHANGRPASASSWLDGKLHGLGVTWNEDGKMTKCGRFEGGQLKEQCAVPCIQLPADPAGANSRHASLLFPDGCFYRGQVNEQFQRHGKGHMYSADGMRQPHIGRWLNDALQPGKALLIGNNAYEQPLRCCRKDAEDMQTVLVQLGFKCTLLLDGTRRQMIDSIATFLHSLQRGDIVFIYFSGHGEESEGVTHLLPTDYSSSDNLDNAVSLNYVMQKLNRLDRDLTNILVLDCCRSDDGNRTFRSRGRAPAASLELISPRLPKDGYFFVAFSTDPGTDAIESGLNGHFTGCLLPELVKPGARLTDSVALACDELKRRHPRQQRPWVHHTPGSRLTQLVLLPAPDR